MSYGQRPEAIDTRWVFRAYAIAATACGLALVAMGPEWLGTDFGDERWAKAALIRVFGSILIGAGCCAEAMGRLRDASERRMAMLWFAAAHGVVVLVGTIQQKEIWGPGIGQRAMPVLLAVAVLLAYLALRAEGEPVPRALTTLFGMQSPQPAEQLRSAYEQQIREAGRQEERNRLARDLHDSIKQQIFVVQTAAATAQTRFSADPAGAKDALEQVRGAARDAMTEMQVMLDQLRAAPLENSGLIEALKRQCEALELRTGAKVELKASELPKSEALPPGAHQALLRVAQEALANVGRHARAHRVTVSIMTFRGEVELRVKDDGAGFDVASAGRGLGIANMQARAGELGGNFEINSRPGAGTSVVFTVPYMRTEAPKTYWHRAAGFGVCAVATAALFVRRPDWLMGFIFSQAAVWAAQNALAYRRVRGGAAR